MDIKNTMVEDMINNPSHYQHGGKEVIDIIKDATTGSEFEGYCMGNIIKYICRYNYKNKSGIDDVKKLIAYAGFLIKYLEEKELEDEKQNF